MLGPYAVYKHGFLTPTPSVAEYPSYTVRIHILQLWLAGARGEDEEAFLPAALECTRWRRLGEEPSFHYGRRRRLISTLLKHH